jgi:hypothetical protein
MITLFIYKKQRDIQSIALIVDRLNIERSQKAN